MDKDDILEIILQTMDELDTYNAGYIELSPHDQSDFAEEVAKRIYQAMKSEKTQS